MELDSVPEDRRAVPVGKGTAVSAVPKFDPVSLELGEAGEDGERLVFRKYRSRVQRYFEKHGFPAAEAEELTQETFLRVFRSEAKLDNRPQLEAWLFEIARNVWANARRDQAARKRSATLISLDEPRLDGEPREVADPAFTADKPEALAGALTREQLEVLQRALAELPEQMRQCVRLRLKDDLKYREIATLMRISVETVKSHLHQAKKRLRLLLEPYFGPIDFEA